MKFHTCCVCFKTWTRVPGEMGRMQKHHLVQNGKVLASVEPCIWGLGRKLWSFAGLVYVQ